jgi:V/A-type H+-transporting ATPase subunit E
VGHEELVRHLIRDAEARREGILGRAREEADRIAEDARRRSEALEREALAEARREAERERRIRMDRARREARALRLRATASLADAVTARLAERLARLAGEERYPRVAERLYREILPELPPGNVILRADERAREALEPVVSDPRIRFGPLPGPEIGGVEASDEEGTFVLRNTLRARFAKALPALRTEVGRRLNRPDE